MSKSKKAKRFDVGMVIEHNDSIYVIEELVVNMGEIHLKARKQEEEEFERPFGFK